MSARIDPVHPNTKSSDVAEEILGKATEALKKLRVQEYEQLAAKDYIPGTKRKRMLRTIKMAEEVPVLLRRRLVGKWVYVHHSSDEQENSKKLNSFMEEPECSCQKQHAERRDAQQGLGKQPNYSANQVARNAALEEVRKTFPLSKEC
ncbi:hypothetical protein QTO34_017183 [Cnephaeus nilssonii]|uniref:Uncharacterized protein n=1 Tax=Cnephaeus nilssonii TaxID=3371016 RepID=A0AA40I0M0_CNENI|nr:hypothetical protein QTO34_017183 [Eptesicus nilssonii]